MVPRYEVDFEGQIRHLTSPGRVLVFPSGRLGDDDCGLKLGSLFGQSPNLGVVEFDLDAALIL